MASEGFKSVFIAGATGQLGEPITRGFLNEGWDVYVLARADSLKDDKKKSKLDEYKALGAKLVLGDIENVDSFQDQLVGKDVVVSTLSQGGFACQIALVQACRKAGVKRFVPSEFGIDTTKCNLPIFGAKKAVKDELSKGGLDHTYVYTGFWYETSFGPHLGFDAEKAEFTALGDGNQLVSMISLKDVGRVLPKVINNHASKNATVRLCAETVSYNHLGSAFEKASGKVLTKNPNLTVDQLKTNVEEMEKNQVSGWAYLLEQLRLSLATGQASLDSSDSHAYGITDLQTIDQHLASVFHKQ